MSKQIVKVYSGKIGCMCGCRGKWSYAGENDRSVKLISGKVLRDPNAKVDSDANCVYVEADGRIRAVYYAD